MSDDLKGDSFDGLLLFGWSVGPMSTDNTTTKDRGKMGNHQGTGGGGLRENKGSKDGEGMDQALLALLPVGREWKDSQGFGELLAPSLSPGERPLCWVRPTARGSSPTWPCLSCSAKLITRASHIFPVSIDPSKE